jgi:hypothetical protein
LLLVTAVAATSCELEEIPVDEGDPITVVNAVMRPDVEQQWVLVETSLTGASEDFNETGSVPGGVGRPVLDAFVTVANASFPGDPCGAQVAFDAEPVGSEDETAGVYWSPVGCPTMRPGDTLELRVETPDGTVVTGSTEIPGISGATLTAGGVEQAIPGQIFAFNRDVDTLVAEVDPIRGRALQIEVGERGNARPSWVFVDSSSITLPGDIPNFFISDFDFDDVPDLFLPGVYYDFTTAWTDRNYFDFVRSMNSPLSGRGFINNLEGGLGVFGSMVAVTNELRVVGNVDDPAEGRYQLSGVIDGVAVDITWELYTHATNFANLTGFVTGTWYFGDLDNYVTGRVDETNRFDARLFQEPGNDQDTRDPTFFLSGQLSPSGGTFPITVFFRSEAYTIQGRRLTP